MKNENNFFLEKRFVMFAGFDAPKPAEGAKMEQGSSAPGADAETRGTDAAKKADQRLEDASALSASKDDQEVKEEAGKIKAPKDRDEALKIWDKYIQTSKNQIDSFTRIEERFSAGGKKDAAVKRKLIAAVEAAGGVVSQDEYYPRPSNTLYDSPAKGEYGYKELYEDISGQEGTDDVDKLIACGGDPYYWSKFARQMVAINKRAQAAKTAYDTTK